MKLSALERDDDAIKEHYKWSSQCEYIKMVGAPPPRPPGYRFGSSAPSFGGFGTGSSNTLELLSQMTWIGVNTSLKFHLRQLRHWVFFGAIWPLHLGTLRKLHTKHWFALSSSMQHLFGIPIMKLRLDRWRRYRGQLPGGPAGDGETPVASATCLTILSGHPWRPAGSSLP